MAKKHRLDMSAFMTDPVETDKAESTRRDAPMTTLAKEAINAKTEEYTRLKDEVEQLKTTLKEKDEIETVIKQEGVFLVDIDPRECQPIKIPGRIQELLNEDLCKDLIDDFNSHIGQKESIYLREIPDHVEKINENIKYEVFAGTRRLWSANFLVNGFNPNFRLKGWVKSVTDEEASVFTEKENAKKQWADVEFGFFYTDLLKEGVYRSARELSRKRNIHKSTVDRLLDFGRLREDCPTIIQVFQERSDLLHLKMIWVKRLLKLIKNSESAKQSIVSKSQEILGKNKKWPATKLFNELVKAGESISTNKRIEPVTEVIRNPNKESIGMFTRSGVNNIEIKIKSRSTLTKSQMKTKIVDMIDKYYVPKG